MAVFFLALRFVETLFFLWDKEGLSTGLHPARLVHPPQQATYSCSATVSITKHHVLVCFFRGQKQLDLKFKYAYIQYSKYGIRAPDRIVIGELRGTYWECAEKAVQVV